MNDGFRGIETYGGSVPVKPVSCETTAPMAGKSPNAEPKRPDMTQLVAVSWWSLLCEPERTRAILSIVRAMCGNSSPMRRPGTLLSMWPVLAANFSAGVGLEIEAIVMRQAAAEIDEDDRLGSRLVLAFGRGERLLTEETRQRQAEGGEAPTRRKSRRETPLHSADRAAEEDVEHETEPCGWEGAASVRRVSGTANCSHN